MACDISLLGERPRQSPRCTRPGAQRGDRPDHEGWAKWRIRGLTTLNGEVQTKELDLRARRHARSKVFLDGGQTSNPRRWWWSSVTHNRPQLRGRFQARRWWPSCQGRGLPTHDVAAAIAAAAGLVIGIAKLVLVAVFTRGLAVLAQASEVLAEDSLWPSLPLVVASKLHALETSIASAVDLRARNGPRGNIRTRRQAPTMAAGQHQGLNPERHLAACATL